MIPVEPKPAPVGFVDRVQVPGEQYLRESGRPVATWKDRDYWTHCLDDLRSAYDSVCAYSCHWIPRDQIATVDHFVPKSTYPERAYQWDNYRLASGRMNSRKGEYTDILDPFTLALDWFILEFPSLLVKPNPSLPQRSREQVVTTISRLRLNDEIYVGARQDWLDEFLMHGEMAWLYRRAPFIAHELERQELPDRIARMMLGRFQ